MDLVTSLPTFVVAIVLISASPGPAMVLILRRAVMRGWRGAVPTVLGLEAGLYAWALLAAAGFAALVAASEGAFLALRIVGASVLVYLGVRARVAAWRYGGMNVGASRNDPTAASSRWRWWKAFWEGAMHGGDGRDCTPAEGAVLDTRVCKANLPALSRERLCLLVCPPMAGEPGRAGTHAAFDREQPPSRGEHPLGLGESRGDVLPVVNGGQRPHNRR
ncbi:MAG: LysE family translocator [Pseudonocardiaceae bacterium]